jgi:hypothetical protein
MMVNLYFIKCSNDFSRSAKSDYTSPGERCQGSRHYKTLGIVSLADIVSRTLAQHATSSRCSFGSAGGGTPTYGSRKNSLKQNQVWAGRGAGFHPKNKIN